MVASWIINAPIVKERMPRMPRHDRFTRIKPQKRLDRPFGKRGRLSLGFDVFNGLPMKLEIRRTFVLSQ